MFVCGFGLGFRVRAPWRVAVIFYSEYFDSWDTLLVDSAFWLRVVCGRAWGFVLILADFCALGMGSGGFRWGDYAPFGGAFGILTFWRVDIIYRAGGFGAWDALWVVFGVAVWGAGWGRI